MNNRSHHLSPGRWGGGSEEIWGGELYGSQGEQRWDQSWPTEYIQPIRSVMVVLQSLMKNRQIFHFYRGTTSPHPTPTTAINYDRFQSCVGKKSQPYQCWLLGNQLNFSPCQHFEFFSASSKYKPKGNSPLSSIQDFDGISRLESYVTQTFIEVLTVFHVLFSTVSKEGPSMLPKSSF